jgi:hypothetical protein
VIESLSALNANSRASVQIHTHTHTHPQKKKKKKTAHPIARALAMPIPKYRGRLVAIIIFTREIRRKPINLSRVIPSKCVAFPDQVQTLLQAAARQARR